MKIIRRLTSFATIYRWDEPGPSGTFWKKRQYRFYGEAQLTVEQQLVKYGYRRRYPEYGWLNFLIPAAFFLGVATYFYLVEINRNDIRVRDKYRILERQLSYVNAHYRHFYFKFSYWFEKNIFPHEFTTSEPRTKLFRLGEAVLRYQQYLHYQKHRNNKYQFMDIGTVNRYPYPAPRKKQ